MSCTFQSAFQRQLFIKTFSGTCNQENVNTTDVQSVRGEDDIASFTSCDLFLTSVFKLVLTKNFCFFFPCYVSDQIVCYGDSFKVFMTTRGSVMHISCILLPYCRIRTHVVPLESRSC